MNKLLVTGSTSFNTCLAECFILISMFPCIATQVKIVKRLLARDSFNHGKY